MRTLKTLAWFVAAALVAGLVITLPPGIFDALAHPDPKGVVQSFLQTETAGDYDVMRRFVTKETVRIVPPNDKLPSKPKSWMAEWTRRKVQLSDGQMSSDRATITATAAEPLLPWLFPLSSRKSVSIVLVKEGQDWKIDLQATRDAAMKHPVSAGS